MSGRALSRRLATCVTASLLLTVTACGSVPNEKADPVDGRRVEYSLNGHASPAPTVIFENGLDGKMGALKPMEAKSELANDANDKRREIDQLHPGSKQVWVDSGHAIPLDRPDAVIAAIREVLPRRDSPRQ